MRVLFGKSRALSKPKHKKAEELRDKCLEIAQKFAINDEVRFDEHQGKPGLYESRCRGTLNRDDYLEYDAENAKPDKGSWWKVWSNEPPKMRLKDLDCMISDQYQDGFYCRWQVKTISGGGKEFSYRTPYCKEVATTNQEGLIVGYEHEGSGYRVDARHRGPWDQDAPVGTKRAGILY